MKTFFLFFLLGATIAVFAEEWYPGTVILRNQKVLHGDISIRQDCDVVILRNGDAMMVYPAHRVESLYFYESDKNIKRSFVSVRQLIGQARVYQLYELLLEGDVTILRTVRSAWQSIHLEVEDYEYYVLHNNKLVPLTRFRRKVFRKLMHGSSDFQQYVRDSKLSPYRLADTLIIFDYVNRKRLMDSVGS